MQRERLSGAALVGVYHQLPLHDRHTVDLWREVVAQALRDMALDTRNSRNQELISTQLEALQWIGTEDFLDCCELALIDAEELELRLREILALRLPYRRLVLRSLAAALCDPPPTPESADASLDAGLVDEPDLTPDD